MERKFIIAYRSLILRNPTDVLAFDGLVDKILHNEDRKLIEQASYSDMVAAVSGREIPPLYEFAIESQMAICREVQFLASRESFYH